MPPLKELEPSEFSSLAADSSTFVLDVRNFEAFGGQHIPGAYSIDIDSNFPTISGWLLPPEKDILLVSEGYEQAVEASIELRRVGLDRIYGYLVEVSMHGLRQVCLQDMYHSYLLMNCIIA
jgi:rhodanese-related sulfurtransferase